MSQVKDILDSIKHRLPDRTNIYPSLNRAIRLINKRLFYHQSSMIQGALSVTIAAGASTGSLPSDFWGLLENPYENGETYALKPLPNQETGLVYNTDSTPYYFKITGTTINLYPGSTAGTTINGAYWAKPTALTKMSDTLPFNELFDDAIEEVLIQIYTVEKPVDLGVIREFLYAEVDAVVPYIDRIAPTRIPDNLHFNSLTESGGW